MKITHKQNLLDEATAKDWTVVDIKNNWKRIYAFEK
jgi:hypothetical protein